MFNVVNNAGVRTEATESDFVEIMDAMYQEENARGPARGPWIARSKLMQLDFIYSLYDQLDAKRRREFWTDMAFLSMRMGGAKGFFWAIWKTILKEC